MELVKVDKENNATKLNGAEFKLYADVNGAKGDEIKVVKVSDGVYRVADSKDSNEVIADTIVVDENGKADVLGLNALNYKLEEVKAPEGYTMLDYLEDVTVGRDITQLVEVKVLNNTGVTLPFVSYGGSSLLFLLMEVGFVLAVSRQIRPYTEGSLATPEEV